MLGDDASLVLVELLKKILEILKEMSKDRDKGGNVKTKEPKKPKIKVGKLSKRAFKKLRKAGMNFGYMTFPKEKLAELEKAVKELGGSFFAMQPEDGNNAVIAVPQQYVDLVNAAMKHVVAEVMTADPNALKIKDGADKIDEADMKLTADILRSHDIPVYSFQSSDGKYMNVVPDEFNGQYEAAMKEVRELSGQLKNIEITRYEQTSPLDSLDVLACKMSSEAAAALYSAAKYNNLDVQFTKVGDDIVATYPAAIAKDVEKLQQEFTAGVEESEKFLIDVKDNTITMDVEKLLKGEDAATYFVRVPNTSGQDFLRLDKSDVEVVNGGKTLSMKLDNQRSYTIFDEAGNVKSERIGFELAKSYNTKSMYANQDTAVVKYSDSVERIDLYNAEKNQLISLGIDRADKIRAELLEQGLSIKATEMLLKDINDKLPDEYKDIFNYTAEKTEIVYADIPNIGEYLAQSQLSQQLIGKAECYGEIPKDNGSKCCVYDSAANRFTVLPVLPKAEVQAKLSEMGYSELSAKEIADRVVSSYRDTDKVREIQVKEEKTIVPKTFESNNPELANMMFHQSTYGMLIVQESADQYKYMDIDKGTPMADVEKALLKNFDIKDEMTAAEIMKQLAKDGIIELPAAQNIDDVAISRLSSNMVEISNGDNSVIMPKDKIDAGRLEGMGISAKTVTSIEKSIRTAEKSAKNPAKQTLQQLKSFAAEAVKVGNGVKDKVMDMAEKVKPKSGQER